MTRTLLPFALVVCTAPLSMSAPPVAKPESARIQALVRQLSSPVFADRDTATRELREMGRHALAVLSQAATQDPDPEVRSRCEWLIPFAKADDLSYRIQAFLDVKDDKRDHNLPGWKQFQTIVKDTPANRKLFADLLTTPSNRTVIAAMDDGNDELERQLTFRQQELYQLMYPQQVNGVPVTRYTPTKSDVATLLLVECQLKDRAGGVRYGISVSSLLYQQQLRSLFGEQPEQATMTALLLHWLNTRNGPTAIVSAMTIAGNLNLKQTGDYAVKVIDTKNIPVYSRAQAIMMIGKVNAADKKEALTKLLDDATVVRTLPNQGETQMRDLALAMLLVLEGENTADYGFRTQSTSVTSKFYYWNYRFANDDDRKKAFEKWNSRPVKK